jgi:hypothetical protein
MSNNNGSQLCPRCNEKMESVKLYSPEILKIFTGGNKIYDRQGILTHWFICLNETCEDGMVNMSTATVNEVLG